MEPLQALVQLAESGTPPTAELALRMSVGLNQAISLAEMETLPFVAAGGASLQFIDAPYGRGKTHFLKAVQQSAIRQGFVTAYVDCGERQSPFQSLDTTYRSIAESMRAPIAGNRKLSRGVAGVIDAILDDGGRSGLSKAKERLLNSSELSPDFRNIALAYATESVSASPSTRLLEDLRALLLASPTYKQSMGSLYKNHRHLPRPMGKLAKRNAGVWLRSLFCLPEVLGYPGLVVLFDETEPSSTGIGLRQRLQHLAHLRTFVDHMAVGAFRGCAIYCTVVGDFSEFAGQYLGALQQRLERVRVPLRKQLPNPRAISVSLDELTNPGPDSIDFYLELGRRIIELGREAGLAPAEVKSISTLLSKHGEKQARSIRDGAVREFVKLAAGEVAMRI